MNDRQVYWLFDPLTNTPFYVGIGKPGRSGVHVASVKRDISLGKTINPRNTRHLHIAKLLDCGVEPIVEILHTDLSKEEARQIEISLIAELGRLDQGKGPLTNRTKGGEWICDIVRDEEWLRKMSESNKISQNRPEVKLAKSIKMKGQKRTPEQVQNIRNAQLAIGHITSEKRMGSKNPSAKPVIVNGVLYGSCIDAANALGIGKTPWQLRRKFKVEVPVG